MRTRGSRRQTTPRSDAAADQPPEPLPKLEDGRRQRVLREPVPALGGDPLAPRLDERIVRGLEGELVDHEQRQRLAGNVDALPERPRRDEHGVDLVAEPLEQALARRFALDEQLDAEPTAEPVGDRRERAVRAREHERAAGGQLAELGHLVGDGRDASCARGSGRSRGT